MLSLSKIARIADSGYRSELDPVGEEIGVRDENSNSLPW